MAVPVRSGRFFTEEDRAGSVPVAVISETLAKAYWPDQSAIGQRVRRPSRRVTVPWVTIVGVVGDIRVGMQSNPQPRIYRPFSQTPARALSLILKTAVDPVSVVSAVQNAVWEIDPTLPVTQIVTMDELISRDVAQPRFQATLLGVLAALAGVLAVVGIYGVMAYSVTQRIPEFGVRMALGAEPSRIVRAVLRRSALLAAAGLAVGAGLVAVSSRVIAWLETGGPTRIGLFLDQGTFVNATDPLLVATAGVVLAAAALLAGAVPALRASKVDPLEALRRE